MASMSSTLGSVAVAFQLGATPLPSTESWRESIGVELCTRQEVSLPSQSEDALDATLLVQAEFGTGSAVLISTDGFALTAAHVVGDAVEVGVLTRGGESLMAEVVRVNEGQDIALLRIVRDEAFACLTPLESNAPLGSDVFILGSPAGQELSFSVSKGIVSAYRDFEGVRFVQIDASVNPGNSGGPAVDDTGHIVGIASWKVSHVSMEGLAFAVPTDVGLDALGVKLGSESSPQWRSLRGRLESAVGGTSSSSQQSQRSSESGFNPKAIRRQRAKRSLIVWGSVTLVAGLIPLVTSAALAREEHITTGRWRALTNTNTVGWAVAITGGGLLTLGLALPKIKTEKAEVSFAPSSRGLSIAGRF